MNPETTDLAAELASTGTGSGVIWSLTTSTQLNLNLVRLEAAEEIAEHVNSEVEVALIGVAGEGAVVVDGSVTRLGPSVVVLVPLGASRAIRAGAAPLAYLSVHRRRQLSVRSRRTTSRHE